MQCHSQEFLWGKPTFTSSRAVPGAIINAGHMDLPRSCREASCCPELCCVLHAAFWTKSGMELRNNLLWQRDWDRVPEAPRGRGTVAEHGRGHVARAPNRETPVLELTSIRNQK